MSLPVRVLMVALLAAAVPVGAASSARADDPPTISIHTDKTVYSAASTATFVVTVHNGGNQDLRLHAVRADGSEFDFVGADSVTDDQLERELFTDINTHVTATIGTTSASVDLKVRPVLATGAGGKHGTSGRYAVYAKGAKPLFASQSYPKRPGEMCLRHEVQRLKAGAWRRVTLSGCRAENSKGQVSWRWAGKHASKVKFRVRATFGGDSRNLPGVAGWAYFRLR